MNDAAQAFPIVHAVTDSTAVMQEDFLDRASSIMTALGPRGALHLRSSRISGKKFHELASALALIQLSTRCWLIVNDRLDVAAAVKARGAQLASHSLLISDARIVCPDMPLGASIHSVEEAKEAEQQGATWCVAGTVFETPSHVGRPPARLEFVEAVANAVSIPVIAIGGVMPEDVASLCQAGAYGVATIRGAAWNHKFEAPNEQDNMFKTRLPVRADVGYVEPVTRYISAYDSISRADDPAHGERNTEGAGS
jgi:thiazole tautomerase (transcriptional regulator TenI)